MNLIQRIQDILLKPKDTWPQIAAEASSVASIYKPWLLVLAAIPALATFLGFTVLGGPLGFRLSLSAGLTQLVFGYLGSLAMVYVMALIVDALAPSFGGRKDFLSALKLIAFGCTAAFVGGVFNLIQALSVLALIAAVYTIYLIYLGLPVLMQCPVDKAPVYTAVIVVAAIVVGIVFGAISAAVSPARWGGGISFSGRDGSRIDVDTSKLEEMAKRMEAAGKQAEAAQQGGDNKAAGEAIGAMVGAMTGASGKPIDPAQLKASLPEQLAGLARRSIEAQSGGAMGVNIASAKAVYGDGDKEVRLEIVDSAGLASIASWANLTVDRETEAEIERVYKQGQQTIREEFRKDGSQGEISVVLGNGLVVSLQGSQLSAEQLRKALASLELTPLEGLQRAR